MKHTQLLLPLLAAVLLAGCGCDTCKVAKNADEKAICKSAYGYIIATSNYEIDEAAQYASKETREVTLPFIKNVLLPLVDSAFLASSVPATATIDSILVEGDSAWVGYTKTTPLGESQGTLPMVKEDGKWLAYVPMKQPDPILVSDSTADSLSAVFD